MEQEGQPILNENLSNPLDVKALESLISCWEFAGVLGANPDPRKIHE